MGVSMKRRGVLGLALASAVMPMAAVRAQAAGLVIFAAASLKNALDEIAAVWTKETGKAAPRISYAASSALAKQMEQGAPADLFLSADLDWMDYVEKKDLIQKDTRFNLLGNKIVLIAPKDSKVTIGVKDQVAQADNVRAALLLVSRGEAPLGIVYSTDAAAEPNVKIVGTFPADSHPPIIYPAAVIKDAKSADAKPFLDYLKSAKARPAFEKQGFAVLVKSNSAT